MKIAVVGCGAMGGLFAAHLAQTQSDVWGVDIWAAHVAAIATGGLVVQTNGIDRTTKLHATTDSDAPGVADIVLIFVKHGQTRAAAAQARPLIGPGTLLVTVQNGLGPVDIIRGLYPDNPLLFGFTPLTSEVLRPGVIAAGGAGPTCMWPINGQVTPAMQAFCALLTQSGIEAALTPGIQTEIWKKLVVNCCLNPVCALTGLTVGAACGHPDYRALMEGVLHEIVALAQARRIALDTGTAHAYFAAVSTAARNHLPSMVADFRARRPTEIDALNGAILRQSAEHGLAAPFNQALVSLVRMAEAGWQAA